MIEPVASTAWLIPLPGGPALAPLTLSSTPSTTRGISIGRGDACDLRLEDARVSRPHAQFAEDGGRWRICDQSSRWGTYVNGQKIPAGSWVPIADGDHIQITPWTFLFSTRGIARQGMRAVEDAANTVVRTISGTAAQPLKEELLSLLLEGSSTIQTAKDESALHEALVEIASRGTGLPNAAIVRVLDSSGGIEIVAQRAAKFSASAQGGFSRSLLTAAAGGEVAELSASDHGNVSHSLIGMNVQAAICAPIMVGATVAAYLYLDSRGAPGGGFRMLRANAAGFCQALARMGGLALANLKRIETEMRMVRMEAELEAAATAQNMILPRGRITSGNLICHGTSRPSKHLGGDFFDAIALPDGRLVVTLGDVAGHGAAAAVLMTAAQGFLRASFRYHQDVARAVTDLDAYLQAHYPPGKFITLWIGLFDSSRNELTYLDAGHGFALLLSDDGTFKTMDASSGPPLNVDADSVYCVATQDLQPGDRLLIISDGIKEQPQANPGDSARVEFGLERIKSIAAAQESDDLIERLFTGLYDFAGTKDLADDATAVLVRWHGTGA